MCVISIVHRLDIACALLPALSAMDMATDPRPAPAPVVAAPEYIEELVVLLLAMMAAVPA